MKAITEQRVREIAREEIYRALAAPTGFVHPNTTTASTCGLRNRDGRVCIRPPKHGQRHLYRWAPVKTTPPPDNGWRDINSFPVNSGSRTYTIEKNSPVKVKGFGKGGGWQTGWYVTRIQAKHPTLRMEGAGDLDNINVEVNREGSHTRTVKATRIGYVRPSSKAGRASVKR